jgi:hypothetical protein
MSSVPKAYSFWNLRTINLNNHTLTQQMLTAAHDNTQFSYLLEVRNMFTATYTQTCNLLLLLQDCSPLGSEMDAVSSSIILVCTYQISASHIMCHDTMMCFKQLQGVARETYHPKCDSRAKY